MPKDYKKPTIKTGKMIDEISIYLSDLVITKRGVIYLKPLRSKKKKKINN